METLNLHNLTCQPKLIVQRGFSALNSLRSILQKPFHPDNYKNTFINRKHWQKLLFIVYARISRI